jgi:hypothetical protein
LILSRRIVVAERRKRTGKAAEWCPRRVADVGADQDCESPDIAPLFPAPVAILSRGTVRATTGFRPRPVKVFERRLAPVYGPINRTDDRLGRLKMSPSVIAVASRKHRLSSKKERHFI